MKNNAKITYVISNINKALEFEWTAVELSKKGYKINYILLNKGDSQLENFLYQNNIEFKTITFRNKYSLPYTIYKLYRQLIRNQPDIIHCHLFEASLAGLVAAKLSGIKNRLHTRHHSTWHHNYHKNAVKYDKLNNFLSTKIIAISEVVKNILIKEGVSQMKIEIVHHGIELSEFSRVEESRVIKLKNLYNNSNRYPIVGVISRYTEWKGIQYIIPAFEKILEDFPNALLILANAKGDYQKKIQSMLDRLPENSFTEVEFENDLFALYKLFTIFVHVPIDPDSEAFGQVYIESMAAGIPMICTRSGIGCEILKHENNAFIVPYKDTASVYEAMKRLLNNKQLRVELSNNALETVKDFTLKKKINRLNEIYTKLL